MKKKIFLLLFLFALGAVVIFKDHIFSNSQDLLANTTPIVNVQNVERQNVSIKRELPGRAVAYQIAEIRPQVNGIIIDKMFTEGELVKQGQQLYQIDPKTYQASYNSSLAKLKKTMANEKTALAKKNRYKKFGNKNHAISLEKKEEAHTNYEQALADMRIAESEVEHAKIKLDYTKVYAPISGYIGKSSVTKGALVTANQHEVLAIITDLNPIYVDVNLSSNEFHKLQNALGEIKDTSVKLIFNNDQEYEQTGKLLFHEVNVDKSTNSVQLRAIFPNDHKKIFPGMFVRIILDESHDNALLIPQNITWRDAKGDLFVWTVNEENIANPTKIKSNEIINENWLIEDGIEPGTKIITENFMNLKPGTKVQIQKN